MGANASIGAFTAGAPRPSVASSAASKTIAADENRRKRAESLKSEGVSYPMGAGGRVPSGIVPTTSSRASRRRVTAVTVQTAWSVAVRVRHQTEMISTCRHAACRPRLPRGPRCRRSARARGAAIPGRPRGRLVAGAAAHTRPTVEVWLTVYPRSQSTADAHGANRGVERQGVWGILHTHTRRHGRVIRTPHRGRSVGPACRAPECSWGHRSRVGLRPWHRRPEATARRCRGPLRRGPPGRCTRGAPPRTW